MPERAGTWQTQCYLFLSVLIRAYEGKDQALCGLAKEYNGGWGGIRTHEELTPLPVFKTGAFNRSATHPSD